MTGVDIEGPTPLPSGGRRLAGATAGMAVGTALSRVTGLARVVAQTAALGGSGFADSYNLANTTPNIVTDIVIGGVLSATFVPVFVDHLATRRSKEAWQAISAVVTVTVVVLVVATVAFFLLAPDIVRLYTVSNHNPDVADQQRVATYLLRWFVPQLTCYGLIALFTALLNSRGKFAMPMFVPIANNVVVIVVLAWFHSIVPHPTLASVDTHHHGLVLLAFGTTLGVIIQTILLVPSLMRAHLHLEFRWQPGHEAVRTITRLAGWTFGFVLANQVALFVVLALADGASPGAVSAYTYAYQFFLLPYGIVAVSLMTAVAPSLAARWARRDTVAFRRRMAFGLRGILAIVIPSAVGMIVLAHPLIDLVLFHGAESASAANSTAAALAMFALGLPGFSTFLYMVRVLQSMQDTRTAFQLYLLENGVNIVLAVALVGPLGVRGLALSVSVAYTVAAVAAMAVIRRRVGGLDAADLGRPLRRVVAATGIMAVATVLAVNVTGSSSDAGLLFRVVFAGVVGVAVYLGSVVVLGGRAERGGGGLGGGEPSRPGPSSPGAQGLAAGPIGPSGPAESKGEDGQESESRPVPTGAGIGTVEPTEGPVSSESADEPPDEPPDEMPAELLDEPSDDLSDETMSASTSASASVPEGFRGRLHDRIAGARHGHLRAVTDQSDEADDDDGEEEDPMARIRVVTDSACDLSDALTKGRDLTIVPLTIRFGDQEFVDRIGLSPSEFWARCADSPVLPETAAPSPGAFQEAFEAALADGRDGVVCITLSGGVSATFQAASTAADSVSDRIPVRVIDSRSLTMGLGLLVLEATDLAAGGATLDEVVERVEALVPHVIVYGLVDTLEHLEKGGRIGGAKALLGSLLSIKPVLAVVDGVVEEESKQRTRGRSLRYLADKARTGPPIRRLAVANGAAPDVDEFLGLLDGVKSEYPLVVSDLGPVVGTHSGPGTIGICALPVI